MQRNLTQYKQIFTIRFVNLILNSNSSVKGGNVVEKKYGHQSNFCNLHNNKLEGDHGSKIRNKAESSHRRKDSRLDTPSHINEKIQEKYRFKIEFY